MSQASRPVSEAPLPANAGSICAFDDSDADMWEGSPTHEASDNTQRSHDALPRTSEKNVPYPPNPHHDHVPPALSLTQQRDMERFECIFGDIDDFASVGASSAAPPVPHNSHMLNLPPNSDDYECPDIFDWEEDDATSPDGHLATPLPACSLVRARRS